MPTDRLQTQRFELKYLIGESAAPLHTNFALSADGEYLGLIAADLRYEIVALP
jgi:hypothetical protein